MDHYFPLKVLEGIKSIEHRKKNKYNATIYGHYFSVFFPCPISTFFHPFRLMRHHSSGAMTPYVCVPF